MSLRDNWRILMLAVLLVVSGVLLFVPTGSADPGANETTEGGQVAVDDGPTNLRYGLQLSGGTRLRAALVGFTAEDVAVTADNADRVERTVFEELDLDPIDVRVSRQGPETGSVEVFDGDVTRAEFAAALRAADLDVSEGEIRSGVTQDTRDLATSVLTRRINQGGLSGGSVSTVAQGTDRFVVVEVPGANRSEVLELIGTPGRVQIVATHPAEDGDGWERTSLLTQGDFRSIGTADQGEGNQPPFVPVTLTDQAAAEFTTNMQELGFTGPGVAACNQENVYNGTGDPGYCLLTVVDGEVTFAADMSRDLSTSFEADGGQPEFLADPSFIMQTRDFEEAQELKLNLESGALPTELDVQSELFLAPSLAERFKPLALLTGLVAWLAVTGAVYYRYRDPRVAAPMLATAGAEVFILLGFAAGVGLALDLSHIAGFIAVIGTGVDDLVIIADEILQRGDIETGRVFQSRFRKAFWVIGAAAATTIIAMSPLAVLSLGDLRGFAIVTIVGVLIGVLVTRPAYGDILRNFLLD